MKYRVNDDGSIQVEIRCAPWKPYWTRGALLTCQWCHKVFAVKEYHATAHGKRLAQQCCSRSCNTSFCNRYKKGNRRVLKNCVICHKAFMSQKNVAFRHTSCGSDLCKFKVKQRETRRRWRNGIMKPAKVQ